MERRLSKKERKNSIVNALESAHREGVDYLTMRQIAHSIGLCPSSYLMTILHVMHEESVLDLNSTIAPNGVPVFKWSLSDDYYAF